MPYRTEHRFQAMGGTCLLVADTAEHLGNHILIGLERVIERLEQKYSRYRPDSLLSHINSAAGNGVPVSIDTETAGLCRYMDQLYQESGGLFDATSGVLRRAWNFQSQRVPDSGQLAGLRPLIDWPSVQWNDSDITLPRAGMELDLGGLVKEYAVDSGVRYLEQHGVQHALFDMAGDLATLGTQADGSPWPVAVRHPRHQNKAVAHLELAGQRLASSGDYERFMTIDGVRYSHHLSPESGRPVAGLLAVSVLAEQCMIAGSVATVAMLQPSDEAGLNWLRDSQLPWLAVDNELRVIGPLAEP